MLRLIRAHGVLLRLAAEYSAAMCGVCPGTLVTWPWLRLSMTYCCALRPWSQICVTCQSCWFLGSVALSCCAGARCPVPVDRLHMYEMNMEHFANQNFSVVVCEMLVVRVCGLRQNFYAYSLYHNPDQDDRIYDCLLTSMVAVQAEGCVPRFCLWVI